MSMVDGYILCGVRPGQCPDAIQIDAGADEHRGAFRCTVLPREGETGEDLWQRTLLIARNLRRRPDGWIACAGLIVCKYDFTYDADDDLIYNMEQQFRYDASYGTTSQRRTANWWLARLIAASA